MRVQWMVGAASATSCAVLLVGSCASHHASEPAEPSTRKVERIDDDFEKPPARTTTPLVMQAKLAHAQAVLEGLALANYAQIDTNAMALKRISQSGDLIPQQSATYFEFSEEFRRVCDDLINHARQQDMQALVADYSNLSNSCVACHTYLRSERPFINIPGKVSWNGAGR